MRVHAVRLTPGTDLKEALQRLVETRGRRAACILSGIGSLSSARLRMPADAGAVAPRQADVDVQALRAERTR
jgi:predicted DNA-binding protein with PD1-like motif